jgi:4-methyl-5(b-hydroxyethyl)-thiazole monophosphate biosynthesis
LFDAVDFAGGAMLVLPGGMPGADNLNRHEGLRSQLLHYHNEGKWIAAICAAPLVLGSLRLLDGKRATAYPGFEDRLGGAIFTDAPVVKAGRIITAKGPGAVFDFGLTLVSCLAGQEKASEVAGQLLLPQ